MPTSSRKIADRPAWLAIAWLVVLASGCSTSSRDSGRYSQAVDSGPTKAVDVSRVADAVPRAEPLSRSGNPASYKVLGKRYYTMKSSKGYNRRGIASWYGNKFHGHTTSSGEPYDMYRMSAAHKTLPLPTYARITNLDNKKSVVVKINDRGPFHDNRLIDLSYAAASRLGILDAGTGYVEVQAIDPMTTGTTAIVKTAPAGTDRTESDTPDKKPELFLQLGAFIDRGNAERLQTRLGDVPISGKPHIQEAWLNQKHLYRVRIGPLDSVDSADRISEEIQQAGLEPPHVVID